MFIQSILYCIIFHFLTSHYGTPQQDVTDKWSIYNKIDFHKHICIHTHTYTIMEPDIIYSQITNDLIQCKIVHTELDKINEKLAIIEEWIRENKPMDPPKKKQKVI